MSVPPANPASIFPAAKQPETVSVPLPHFPPPDSFVGRGFSYLNEAVLPRLRTQLFDSDATVILTNGGVGPDGLPFVRFWTLSPGVDITACDAITRELLLKIGSRLPEAPKKKS